MLDVPIGSIAARVLNRIDDIPTAISGELPTIVNEKIEFIQQYCGVSIDPSGIPGRFQGPLTRLVMSDVLQQMTVLGVDATSLSFGDFSISKGAQSNTSAASEALKDQALEELNALGRAISFSRVIG